MTQSDGATAQAQDKAQEVAGQAKEQAQQKAGQAKDQLRTQVDQRSTQAGEQVSTQAADIRTVAEKLREEGKEKPAQLAEQAAEKIEGVGSYLKDSDADRILHDVEDFGRQKPWAVIAGGMALGFAASRFLKASSGDRYQTSSGSGQTSQSPRTPTSAPTGYSIPAQTGTGLSAAPGDNELAGGVAPAPTPPRAGEAPRPQTPATAPVTGGL
jgi:ElaB/YqjD/DUF883 family membrane-anchored ribosome-binding protein/uncharacterized protein YjbJ (UPF0337 family)